MILKNLLVFATIWTLVVVGNSFDPFSSSGFLAAAGIGGLMKMYDSYYGCSNNECCNDDYINVIANDLESSLERDLFGQHLVLSTVPQLIENHIKRKNPKKALVLSFHGWTGTGKNYVSNLIARSIYKKGMDSQYVHLYIGPRDFPHIGNINSYKRKIQDSIETHTKICGRSLFIFDEVDKMPPGVLDSLTPYVDFHEYIDKVNYRRNIFIFLSNTGGENITNLAFKRWTEGQKREDISLKDTERVISKAAFNEIGGLKFSQLLRRDLIDFYVPFLPLERAHVKQCVQSELQKRHKYHLVADNDFVEKISNELVYFPPGVEVFSTSGCKKVSSKIDVYTF